MINAGLYSRAGTLVPLLGVHVQGEVLGAHARVTVRQRYRNDEARPIEAVYTFPLPADATLSGFAMTADGRRIEGTVREREEAFRQYDDAVVAGHGAALLEQERPNVFTASVGNLLPGEETLVEVEYVQRLTADEGALRWMIPTLVAPRYVPGTPAGDRTGHGTSGPTDRVPDADRVTPRAGIAGVAYGLALDLVFDLGRDVQVESPSHAIALRREEGGRVRVTFAQREVALDRDVVISARTPAGVSGQLAGVSTHRDAGREGADEEGVFALSVVPDLFEYTRRGPSRGGHEVVFVIDVSGSMEGDSIREARAALRLCLRHLREGDRFNVVAFNTTFTKYAPEPVVFTQGTLAAADRWVDALSAHGGTEILQPMLEALRGLRDPDAVLVLLTDGQVANEDEILRSVSSARTPARVYSFGIGTNVSDALLRGLARQSGGAVEFIHPGERIDEKIVAQFSRALSPRVSGVTVKFHGVDAGEIAPSEMPPLVDGDPWVIYGRYGQPGRGRAEIRGTVRGEQFVLEVPVEFPGRSERPALRTLWAAERIRDLEAMALSGRRADAMRDRIVKLAVGYGVSSRYTSFLVVEKRTGDRRAAGQPETRVVPVNLPAGWTMFDTNRDGALHALSGGGRNVNKTSPMRGGMVHARAAIGGFVGAPPPQGFSPPPAPAPAPMARPRRASLESTASASRDEGDVLDGFDPAVGPGEAAPARRSLLERAREMFVPTAKGKAMAPPPPPSPPRAQAPAPPAAQAATPNHGADPIVALLGNQLASGLWDDPGSPGDEQIRRVRATGHALRQLLRAGISTAHALYGVQIRKAVEALVPAAIAVAARDVPVAEFALGVAWLVTSGARTRGEIRDAITAHPALGSLLGRIDDEKALRELVERAG